MIKYKGTSVYNGIVMGKVHVIKPKKDIVKRAEISDVQLELTRINKAINQSREQLGELYKKALIEAGEASAEIFEAHQIMLDDKEFLYSITSMIEDESVNAEFAVDTISGKFSNMFAAMDDDYMKARAADIKDISDRIIKNLIGEEDADCATDEPVIIVAEDLSPSETVRMDKDKVLAFVTVKGSSNSHTAILARMMSIPALVSVNLKLDNIENGCVAIVDGIDGEVIFEPTKEECLVAESKIKEQNQQKELLQAVKGKETVTSSGKKIRLYANIRDIDNIQSVHENDSEGIGLMRSEFLYIGRNYFPTEEEQFLAYKQVAMAMEDKQVIIRTLDIGADKQADYLKLEHEDNPALGYRAIRICLKQPDIFKTQLRALLRAAVYGNISIMYPMIISVDEVKKIYRIVEEVATELEADGISYRVPKQGVMIETPAAVMISDELAEIVDFFSIGTNDLTQYTLAIDRQNAKLNDFCDMHHPAILKMIKMVVDNAHAKGKWVGICGELGADMELTDTFIKMGIDELSVSPSMILKLRQKIRNMD